MSVLTVPKSQQIQADDPTNGDFDLMIHDFDQWSNTPDEARGVTFTMWCRTDQFAAAL